MESNSIPKTVRRLLIIFGMLLAISLLVSGFNTYMTLAAPLRATVFVPCAVGFEGRLADSAGVPVADGDYALTFTLYDQASGGTVKWFEEQTVAIQDGLYSVQLGTTAPEKCLQASDFDGPRWLGIQIGGESEMTPRIPISAVPFALNANQAMGLQGRSVSATEPQQGQVLAWDASANQWGPSALPTSSPQTMPSVRVYNTANISIPYDTWTALTFNSERWDSENIHSTSSNTSRLTAVTSGQYLIFASILWSTHPAAGYIAFKVNGTTFIANDGVEAFNYQMTMSLSTVYHLEPGDYVEVVISTYCSSCSIVVYGNYSPDFGMVWLGP